MSKTFVLTVAVCVWGFVAAVALADKGSAAAQAEKAQAEKAVLLQQIAQLKAMVAKLQAVAVQNEVARVKAIKFRNTAEAHERALAEKGFHKGPHPGHREAVEKLENIRAAVKHLNAAGLKEIAAAVAKQGEQIQAAIEKHHKPGSFKGEFKGGPKGGQPGFFKGGKPGLFKGGPPFAFKGPQRPFKGPQPPFKGPQPPHKGGPFHKPADGELHNQLRKMSEAIGQLSKQVQQLQKTVGELQKQR
jgi:hypothetical protein